MKIEDVEEFSEAAVNCKTVQQLQSMMHDAVNALRAEAWHPIEKAEELGAKDGREIEVWMNVGKGYVHPVSFRNNMWEERGGTFFNNDLLTHFRFIDPPEGA